MAQSLVCPICNEEMVSEAQIEQHIQDIHDKYNSDRTSEFVSLRKSHIEEQALDIQRLETRMRKLLVQISQVEKEYVGLKRFFLEGARREVEQRLVVWEPEESIDRCKICQLKFSYFTRKHHCRVCGQVVCGDVDRNCSREVPSTLLAEKLSLGTQVDGEHLLRMCEECRNSLFGHQNFIAECEMDPPRPVQLWASLKRRRAGIDALLPEFQALVEKVATGAKDPATLTHIKQARTQLYASLAQYDQSTKKLLNQDKDNETLTESRLRQMILLNATEYLQQVMAPLQAVPQIMQSQEQPRMRKDEAQQLQNTVVVLQEQLFMVDGMISDVKKKRHFDELPPLEQSAQELRHEIELVAAKLGNLAPSN